jgi:23S rRNA (uracil1939-C5)-methyltransferase
VDLKLKKTPRIYQTIELTIESLAFEGAGVARVDGMVYFVNGGLPGDRLIAEIVKKKKTYVEARIKEIIEPSPERIEAPCPYFNDCGGCTLQNLDYSAQLHWKRQFVIDSFERIGKVEVQNFLPTLESRLRFRYRNKMEYSFATSRWMTDSEIQSLDEIEQKHFALGLHKSGRFDKVIDITDCLIGQNESVRVIEDVRTEALKRGISALNQRTHEGFLRNLVLRSGSGKLMMILVTSVAETRDERDFVTWFGEHFAGI